MRAGGALVRLLTGKRGKKEKKKKGGETKTSYSCVLGIEGEGREREMAPRLQFMQMVKRGDRI